MQLTIMAVLIIFPVILQTVINVIMLSIGGQGTAETRAFHAADGEDLMILTHTIFDWSTHVTDGQNCNR